MAMLTTKYNNLLLLSTIVCIILQMQVSSNASCELYSRKETQLVVNLLSSPTKDEVMVGLLLSMKLNVDPSEIRSQLFNSPDSVNHAPPEVVAITFAELGVLQESDIGQLLDGTTDTEIITENYCMYRLTSETIYLDAIASFLDSDNLSARVTALALLAKVGHDAANYNEQLLANFQANNPNEFVKYAAIQALVSSGYFSSDYAHEFIMDELNNEVKYNLALFSIFVAPEMDVYSDLIITTLKNSSSLDDYLLPPVMLYEGDNQEMTDIMLELVENDVGRLDNCAYAFMSIGEDVIPLMFEMLDSDDYKLRCVANYVLYYYGFEPDVRIQSLISLQGSEDFGVSDEAQVFLARIRGKNEY